MTTADPPLLAPEPRTSDATPAFAPTLAQRDMWLRQLALGWVPFSIGLVIDIDGPLRSQRLQQAVAELAQTQPILRARIDDTGVDAVWRVEPAVDGYWSVAHAPVGARAEACGPTPSCNDCASAVSIPASRRHGTPPCCSWPRRADGWCWRSTICCSTAMASSCSPNA